MQDRLAAPGSKAAASARAFSATDPGPPHLNRPDSAFPVPVMVLPPDSPQEHSALSPAPRAPRTMELQAFPAPPALVPGPPPAPGRGAPAPDFPDPSTLSGSIRPAKPGIPSGSDAMVQENPGATQEKFPSFRKTLPAAHPASATVRCWRRSFCRWKKRRRRSSMNPRGQPAPIPALNKNVGKTAGSRVVPGLLGIDGSGLSLQPEFTAA